MSKDFSEEAEFARDLIAENSRVVTFIQMEDAPTDPDKPWRANSDPIGTPKDQLSVDVVAVSPSEPSLGITITKDSLLANSEAILLAAPGLEERDLLEFHFVQDGDKLWRIIGGEKLQPGEGPVVLYYVGIAA